MLDTHVNSDLKGKETFAGASPQRRANGLKSALCRLATGEDDVLRVAAVKALGQLGGPEAVATLKEALLDEDADVRSDAAEALARIADNGAAPQLLENLLGDPCREVKLAAIGALAAMRWREAVSWLRRIARARDPEIVWDDDGYYKEGWDDWLDVQLKAVTALGEFGAEEAVDDIIAAITDEDNQDLTEAGFPALATMGQAGIDALAGYLETGGPRLRRRAAVALAQSGQACADVALVTALADPDVDVRRAATEALIVADPFNPLLDKQIADTDAGIRALFVSHRLAHDTALTTVALEDTAEVVRIAALSALLEISDEPGRISTGLRDTLNELADDRSQPAVAALAVECLGCVSGTDSCERLAAILRDTEAPVAMRIGALRALTAGMDQDIVATITDIVGDNSRSLRMECLAALARIADHSPWPNPAGAALLEALDGMLVPLPEEEAAEVVGDAAADAGEASADADAPDPDGGEPAADAADMEIPPANSTLDAILGADSAEAKVARERTLSGNLTPAALEYLAISQKRAIRKRVVSPDAVEVPYKDVRMMTARILGDVARDDVAEVLLAATGETDTDLRRAAADSFARVVEVIPDCTVDFGERLLALMSDADRLVRLAAIRAMGHSGEASYREPIAGLLSDEDAFIRREALTALGRLGASNPEISARCRDSEPGVRLAAIGALVAVKGDAALDDLISFGLAEAGYHIREVAGFLCRFDLAEVNDRLLDILGDDAHMRQWLATIELIGAMNQRVPVEPAAAAGV